MLIGPAVTKSPRNRHDLAYACFLPPVIVSLISALSTVIPMSTGAAGGIGFLVLIPLTLLALVSVPTGIYLSFVLRKDVVLPVLSVLTILIVVEVITEAGSATVYNATAFVYGVLGTILIGSWFLVRRWRVSASRAGSA